MYAFSLLVSKFRFLISIYLCYVRTPVHVYFAIWLKINSAIYRISRCKDLIAFRDNTEIYLLNLKRIYYYYLLLFYSAAPCWIKIWWITFVWLSLTQARILHAWPWFCIQRRIQGFGTKLKLLLTSVVSGYWTRLQTDCAGREHRLNG